MLMAAGAADYRLPIDEGRTLRPPHGLLVLAEALG
jgi:hypothetical protein